MTDNFIDKNPSIEMHWRSIILLGRNVACYKFALAKSLLDLDTDNTLIRMEDLALPFAKNICEHLKTNEKQITASSSKFLDFCVQFNKGEINEEKLKSATEKFGFVNVVDAFHNVARNPDIPRFFEDVRSTQSGIILTDNFHNLTNSIQMGNLKHENISRWNLWETAISMNLSPHLLEVRSDFDGETLFMVNDKLRRKTVTSIRPALIGYQEWECFYCDTEIIIEQGHENSCDVDHFFPDTLKHKGFTNVDQVWNLVLSCVGCNRGEGGKFERIPHIAFLEMLHKRNEDFCQSPHPLRETIINQTGKSQAERVGFLQEFFNNAVDAIPSKDWKPLDMRGYDS